MKTDPTLFSYLHIFHTRTANSDCRLPQRCKCDMLSFWILRSVKWQFPSDVSGKTYQSILEQYWTPCLLRVVPIGCPETSVWNYQSALRKISKQGRSELRKLFLRNIFLYRLICSPVGRRNCNLYLPTGGQVTY
jgi:hypothetical protein